jgi:hypothetical protein
MTSSSNAALRAKRNNQYNFFTAARQLFFQRTLSSLRKETSPSQLARFDPGRLS